MEQIDYIAFGVILDDIVFPDGSTVMGALGGGGLQTAFGMRLWSPSVGLAARIGDEHKAMVKKWLRSAQIDHHGIHVTDLPTLRAWQILEQDGRRTQVWRVDQEARQAQLARNLSDLPPAYCCARGFHLGIHPDEPNLEFLAALKSLGGLVSVEPFRPAEGRLSTRQLKKLLALVDIFSTNQFEAASLVGLAEPLQQALRLVEAGAQVAVVRCGEQGSLAVSQRHAAPVHIPACPAQVTNPVGAGNAYCGGFLVGLIESGDLRLAGYYGAVAASLVVERPRISIPDLNMKNEARRRLETLKNLEQLEI